MPNGMRQSSVQQSTGSDIERLSQALNDISASFPTRISKAVFASSLFHSRSEYMADYQAEIYTNLIKLSELVSSDAQYQWLYERCEAQIMAFVQVAMRNQKQVKRAAAVGASSASGSSSALGSSAASTQSSHRQHLQQELVKHHDYERRLKDNLYKAQAEAQISGEHNQVIACQQRLIRCQQAIEKIERQLEV